MYLISLLSVLPLISVSSSLLLPDILNVKLCKNKCKSYGGCMAVRFDSRNLRCQLVFGNDNIWGSGEKEFRIFKVQTETIRFVCDQKERIVCNRRGSRTCVKAYKANCKGVTKKLQCKETTTLNAAPVKLAILRAAPVKPTTLHAAPVTPATVPVKSTNVTAAPVKSNSVSKDTPTPSGVIPTTVYVAPVKPDTASVAPVKSTSVTETTVKPSTVTANTVKSASVTATSVKSTTATTSTVKSATMTSTTEEPDDGCILYKCKNITIKKSGLTLIQLPVTLKTGNRMIVHAATAISTGSSQLTITKDATHPTNILKWVHMNLIWEDRRICFDEGFSLKYLDSLPIADKTNFTITIELEPKETKIYTDETHVKTIDAIPEIVEFNVRKYSHLFGLMIQKMSEECDDADTGTP